MHEQEQQHIYTVTTCIIRKKDLTNYVHLSFFVVVVVVVVVVDDDDVVVVTV